jgi:uncharacterized ion transporter superfamily protein YfcC
LPNLTPPSKPSRFHFLLAYSILIVIIAALTWVILAGQHERVTSEALGKELPVRAPTRSRMPIGKVLIGGFSGNSKTTMAPAKALI